MQRDDILSQHRRGLAARLLAYIGQYAIVCRIVMGLPDNPLSFQFVVSCLCGTPAFEHR